MTSKSPPPSRLRKLAAYLGQVIHEPVQPARHGRLPDRRWLKFGRIEQAAVNYLETRRDGRNILGYQNYESLRGLQDAAEKYVATVMDHAPRRVATGKPTVTHKLLAELGRSLNRPGWSNCTVGHVSQTASSPPFCPALRQMLDDIHTFVPPGTVPRAANWNDIRLSVGQGAVTLPDQISMLRAIAIRPDGLTPPPSKKAELDLVNHLVRALDNADDVFADLMTLGYEPFSQIRRTAADDEAGTYSDTQYRDAAAYKVEALEHATMNGLPFGTRASLEHAWTVSPVAKFKTLDDFLKSPLGKRAASHTVEAKITPMSMAGEDDADRPWERIADQAAPVEKVDFDLMLDSAVAAGGISQLERTMLMLLYAGGAGLDNVETVLPEIVKVRQAAGFKTLNAYANDVRDRLAAFIAI